MSDALKTLLIVVATQLPVIGGLIAAWRTEKPQHQIVAVFLAVIYELGVLVVVFLVKVWKQIEDEAVRNTAQWVIKRAKNITLNFRRRYHEQIISDHNIFNVSGLGLIQTYRIELKQIFVDLRIDPSNPQGFNFDPIGQRELTGNRPIWDFIRYGDNKEYSSVALSIIGPPGSGKTTLLKFIALTLATGRQSLYRIPKYTPILLFLRDHLERISNNRLSLGELVQNYFSDTSSFPNLRPPQEWFQKQLKKGNCLIMLDGLDEIADLQQRKHVSSWIDTQIKNYPRCPFIITARPQGYLEAPLERADMVLEVLPFNTEQVKKFIHNWYRANEEVSSAGLRDDGVQERAAQGANDLLQRLSSVTALSALTVNPLLLTMVAMVHRYRGRLPGSRIQLYAEICEVLLERWRQTRNIQDKFGLSSVKKLVILRPLAAYMMEHELRDIGAQELLQVIATPLERVGISSADANAFLEDLQASSGLLLERETNRWGFAHLTFQEYLTATHWVEQKPAERNWSELINDSWWHETLRLYAAQGDATALVKACLDVDTVPAVALAADFLEESRELDPDVRRLAEEVIIGGLKSKYEARRFLAAEVKLSRRLRSLKMLGDHCEIDPEYVTCAEYQLFLRDLRVQGKFLQPEHWSTSRYNNAWSFEPVGGIYPEDAELFCKWLGSKFGGLVRYRLPGTDEARRIRSNNSKLATWCKDQDQFSLVGLSEENESAIAKELNRCSSLQFPYSIPTPSSIKPPVITYESGVSYYQLCGHLEGVITLIAPFNVPHSSVDSSALDVDATGRLITRFIGEGFYANVRFIRNIAINVAIISARNLDPYPLGAVNAEHKALLERLKNHVAPNLAGDLRRIRDIRQYRELDLGFAKDLISDITVDLKRALAVAKDFSIAALTCPALSSLLLLEVARILTVDMALISIIEKFDQHNVDAVVSLGESLVGWAEPDHFISCFLKLSTDNIPHDTRRSKREYMLYVLSSIYFSDQSQNRAHVQSVLQKLMGSSNETSQAKKGEDIILNFYWWNQVLSLREKGTLWAWESIRIVREDIVHVQSRSEPTPARP